MGVGGDSYEAIVALARGLDIHCDEMWEIGQAVQREINRLRKLAGEPEPFRVDPVDEDE